MPLTSEVLSAHLDARQDRTIGIYPMLQDETCWFLAMDFDKHDWKQDVTAVMELCKSLEIPTLRAFAFRQWGAYLDFLQSKYRGGYSQKIWNDPAESYHEQQISDRHGIL